MRLDPLLKSERVTLAFEAIGDDKVRVRCSIWDDSKVILADQALQSSLWANALCDAVDRPAEYLNIDPTAMADAFAVILSLS